ncbi:MAG TPA: NUDIX domain-containing protein [Devosia sp.]|nr:NUDIX domain-containing protein [Devosia sp.]
MTSLIDQDTAEAGPARQVAALVWRPGECGVEVLLVTSRISGHWLLPKGWPIDGLSAAGAAKQEAFEEAGVWGDTSGEPIGNYAYGKILKNGDTLPCTVDVFAIRALGLLPDWPEKAQRRRQWLTFSSAAARVMEPDLGRFLQQCEERFSVQYREPALFSDPVLADRSAEPDATGETSMLSPAQCRAARALVDWSIARLAKESGVSAVQLRAFERGDGLDPGGLTMIAHAFEDGGAILLPESGGRGAGVRLKFTIQTVKRIDVWENEGGPTAEDDVH